MMKATQKFDGATLVVWLIEKCPVPPGFDAHRVGPCINRYLERLGYSGPRTITALGVLKDIPPEVLRAVSSTGIGFDIDAFGSANVLPLMYHWTKSNPPPANIMVITDPGDRDARLDLNIFEHKKGYNIIEPYPFGPASQFPWESFLLAESPALDEDHNCIQTGESVWVCNICDPLTVHTGFENFTLHISSDEHAREYADSFSGSYDEHDEQYDHLWSKWTPPSESALAYDTTMVMHQPKTSQCSPLDPHMSATPSECHGKDEPEPKRKRN